MFSQACVKNSVRGACVAGGGLGACVAGAAWQGGMCGRGRAWQQTVRILLECILVTKCVQSSNKHISILNFHGKFLCFACETSRLSH